jgi:colanic acid/amylovoran biosynthesis protein
MNKKFNVPGFSTLRNLRMWLRVKLLIRQWRNLSTQIKESRASEAVKHVMILPSDPWTVVGSKGDEAMICAAVQQLQAAETNLQVTVITATEQADRAVKQLGFQPIRVWIDSWELENVIRELLAIKADTVLVLGADALDGFYSPLASARMLVVADTLVRHGMRGVLLGFSFNSVPNRQLKPLFDHLSEHLAINVRDSISLDRFRKFSSARARLVTDTAFMLAPDKVSPNVQAISEWANARRVAGDKVIAFNMHLHLVRYAAEVDAKELIRSSITTLERLAKSSAVSYIFLSHDYRSEVGDDACLEPIYLELKRVLGDRIFYPRDKMSAGELKGAAGVADGVVTGRMHLAIASLGMGVPVAALTYQGKFHGLFRHFGLPDAFLLAPEEAIEHEKFGEMLESFVSRLSELRQTVSGALPGVWQASRDNLKGIV